MIKRTTKNCIKCALFHQTLGELAEPFYSKPFPMTFLNSQHYIIQRASSLPTEFKVKDNQLMVRNLSKVVTIHLGN